MTDEVFMHRALELAKLGLGLVTPNPMVGCVIVRDGKIIGEGYHQKYGGAHAEAHAIGSVPEQGPLKKSTAYVTLEPCAHFGKTPPCADLLIEKELEKVVVACEDPFAQVGGKGIQKLKSAGIQVEVGALKKEAQQVNKRFFAFHQLRRPYVILKWAQTIDGFIAREKKYDSKWIANPYSRQLVHKWRTEEDAILVGKNTAIRDNPQLTSRDWSGKNPVRVLLDSTLEVKVASKLYNDEANTLILNMVKDVGKANVKWVKLDNMNPENVLKALYKEQIQSVIVEGGSQVLNSFISHNCWDEGRVFRSGETFGKGINAPRITGHVVSKEFIFDDQLITYKNFNG